MAQKKVIVYSQKQCGFCTQAENWLTETNIPFEVRDINENENFKNEFVQLGTGGTPTFIIGQEVILGMNKDKVQTAWEAYQAQ